MAEPEVITALRQQAVPAGSAKDVTAPTEGIPHATSYDTWRVAIKLPPFWVDSPEVWFAQVEAQFSLARITQDRTRYDYVVAHLDARYANEVRDIRANPPTANLYEHLKTALIRRLSLLEEQKIRQIQRCRFTRARADCDDDTFRPRPARFSGSARSGAATVAGRERLVQHDLGGQLVRRSQSTCGGRT
ncbi:hypothetical protein HPB49_005747 [Dermacentor silvarum]|uniref:Uncharacterized protein n=1 Tax=Dermacentor silvarum TaxID=543639 RepID=A0ACB8C7J8_DERSI|nr:hypothetical protein HPB49_005747 [Dermacentor silvarum]